MTSKTFASPMFIFFWLLMISIILVQPALSGRTLGSSGGDATIGIIPGGPHKATGGDATIGIIPGYPPKATGGDATIGIIPGYPPKATGGDATIGIIPGGDATIGILPGGGTSSPTNSAPKAVGRGPIGYGPLHRPPICNKPIYARCLPAPPRRPCNYYSFCRPPLPPK
ncbi:uncharacterized protein LOC113765518 isoform X2 [Coffea eugenioides]|uniref:uncharacterized protein LOC113765518 isoform X2 n=1 Tax=Coffea eugenioides TaxID=49369 RepID=UPI000F6062CA|nr:uncharacterized protein LOC113765518 isoform X2 [Coffea eugenioides]